MSYSKKTKDEFIQLRAEGWTLTKASQELKIAYNTAVNWDKEFKEEIAVANAINMEEMLDKYRMTKQKRIEVLGERLMAIQDELEKRDLSDIPTPKLFEMMIKCSKSLEEEVGELVFLSEEEIQNKKAEREADKIFNQGYAALSLRRE